MTDHLPTTLLFCILRHKMWLSAMGLLLLVLIGSVVVSSIINSSGSDGSEKCIQCHIETFNKSLSAASQHVPVFERQCVTCHLMPGSNWGSNVVLQSPGVSTVTQLSQAPKWRKRSVFLENERTLDHVVALTGFSSDEMYRFRISANEIIQTAASDVRPTSQWLALSPKDVSGNDIFLLQEDDVTLDWDETVTADGFPFDRQIRSLSLLRGGKTTIFVSWRSIVMYQGVIELEKTEGIELADVFPEETIQQDSTSLTTSVEKEHPVLRPPEEITIDICYECHPQSKLGTSHPVRLFSRGGETEIPDDLPTINGGMMTCVTCHNPHGGPGKYLVREKIKTKFCVACHYTFKNMSNSTTFLSD